MNRYGGKPFLRLLDSYVLDAIGQLGTDGERGLEALEPRLADVFPPGGSWREIVRSQMDFPPSLPGEIRALWLGFLEQAKKQGLSVSPHEFVMRFVDENFPDIVGR